VLIRGGKMKRKTQRLSPIMCSRLKIGKRKKLLKKTYIEPCAGPKALEGHSLKKGQTP